MRVNQTNSDLSVEGRGAAGGKVERAPDNPTPVAAPVATSDGASPDVVRQHASELQQLRELLRQHPEIRNQLVAQIRRQVASGQYQSARAAEATAGAILRTIF